MPASQNHSNPAPPNPSGARVVVLSRDGCHLCEQAEAIADEVCGPDGWARLDVDQDAHLKARYNDHVPVVWVDGRLLTYWTLRSDQLTGALAAPDWPSPAEL